MEGIAEEIARDHLQMVRVKADYISAACPFHEERTPGAFWINKHTGKWGCFACDASGSDLKYLLQDLGVKNKRAERILSDARKDRHRQAAIAASKRKRKAKENFLGAYTLPESVLGIWDWCPQVLLDEGFEMEVLQRHDVGFDKVRDRITFPIRDIGGNLIGISGRTVLGEEPKYKVYQGWHEILTREGPKRVPGELGDWFPDYSSTDIRDHLWRGQFVYDKLYNGEEDYLIVVEGYKAALWLVQNGWENTVAIMGSRMSPNQERLIQRMGVKTWVFLDANDAGRSGSRKICQRLARGSGRVYEIRYPDRCDASAQPDDLSKDEIEECIRSAVRAVRKVNGSFKQTGRQKARR